MSGWAVITDDEYLCFGTYKNEEDAADAASRVANGLDLSARCVWLQDDYLEEDE